MKKLAVLLVSISFLALSAMAADWTGYVSDSKCGVKGAKDEHADCAAKCVKGGATPVFVTEDGKVLKFDDTAKVMDHIGHKVTITGDVDGDTIKVESVKM